MKKEYALPDAVSGREIKILRLKLGLSRKDFASLTGVSVKTVEHWESLEGGITGPIVLAVRMLSENPGFVSNLEIPVQEYPLRLIYKNAGVICSVIDVDDVRQLVKVKNYTDNILSRAFGVLDNPTYAQYTEFLKSRCMPESRDKLKLELRELGLPFYDPILIIEKTGGRMAEDCFEIEIVRKRAER